MASLMGKTHRIDTTVTKEDYLRLYYRPYVLYEHFTGVCATDANWRPEVYRDYVEEEDVCEFCGNRSKLRDVRGNCVACGANRKEPS